MRGGLDDALDKLARRDELRRRAAGETTGTPPAVQELVEAIAGVVGRNQGLEVTVGVEGVGDPTLLHFFVEEGMVRVTADSTVAARVDDAPRHADFDLDIDMHAGEPFAARPMSPPAPAPVSYDDRDRYDPGTGYDHAGYDAQHVVNSDLTEDLDAARFRSPFAATPPPPVPPPARPMPPHTSVDEPAHPVFIDARPEAMPRAAHGNRAARPARGEPTSPASPRRPSFSGGEETTRIAYGEQFIPEPRAAAEPERGMPTPLPEPIPLGRVDTEETEQAAKRLAALLRDDPTLLRQDRQ